MVAAINIRRDEKDPFYRYKMEPLKSKIEGKGNGIKTVIVNLSSVAQSLGRPPSYLIKYFGFELGAQTNLDPPDDRWIVNGAHDAGKLQDHLDGFINKFVLCRSCKNPETVVQIKNNDINLDCKACGEHTHVDPRLKLSSFIIKHQPKKGKKDKSTKKAERKARKQAQANGQGNGDGASDEGSNEGNSGENSEQGDLDGEVEMGAGSDDELTRRINAEAKDLGNGNGTNDKEIQWSVDTSEAAMKKRAQQLPDDLKKSLVVNGDDDPEGDDADSPYGKLGDWLEEQTKAKGDVTKVDDVDVFLKAQELGIEKKAKTLTVLAQSLFDDNIVKQIDARAGMLKRMVDGKEKNEKALLGGTERFLGETKPNLIPSVSTVLMKYYQHDICSEETLKAWGTRASKRYVDLQTSKKVRKSAEKFMQWLEEADEEEDSDSE
ncbi:MAG: hypothetical protein Q9162_006805 [Coniocarpon cinnabarinum]